MEIRIVGWHTELAPYQCHDCDNRAQFMVDATDPVDGFPYDFNLCRDCINDASRYVVTQDKVEEVFKNLGL